MTNLFQTLEKEFCPPLDSSLVTAMVAEVEFDSDGKPLSPSASRVAALRSDLRELAAHADKAQLSELTSLTLTSPTEGTTSSQDFGLNGTTTDTSINSFSSGSSNHSFSSPLGFLQAALPDVSTSRLKKSLMEVEKSGREIDMWDLVATILSEESIRELEERGLDALDDEDNIVKEEDIKWEVASPKHKRVTPSRPPSKQKTSRRPTKITLVDIRQQNHAKVQHNKRLSASKPPLPDLWIQVQSIAANIATHLHPHPPSYFISYLHSPKYQTPYHALYAALESLCPRDISSNQEVDFTVLSNILDILFSEYEPLDSEQRSRLVEETELCIRATNGRGDDVIDLVKLLRELNSDASSGRWELGVYHLPPPKPPPSPIVTANLPRTREPITPVSPRTPQWNQILSPPLSPIVDPGKISDTDPHGWQTVPVRQYQVHNSPRLAESIPAYAVKNPKYKGSGNGYGKGGKGDVGELLDSQAKIKEHRRKQEEYLREAAKMWQKGDKKTRGGGIAFYYAQKAREFQEMAKLEGLANARIMVLTKRSLPGKSNEIDLHGTTIFEAVTIVKEVLQDEECSPSQPLKIITGKGTHSVNKVTVLKPAIKNALLEDGWVVGTWDAGLVVRGRTP